MPLALEALPHLLALLDDCKDTQILNAACSALDHITNAAAKYARYLPSWLVLYSCCRAVMQTCSIQADADFVLAAGAMLEQPYIKLQRTGL